MFNLSCSFQSTKNVIITTFNVFIYNSVICVIFNCVICVLVIVRLWTMLQLCWWNQTLWLALQFPLTQWLGADHALGSSPVAGWSFHPDPSCSWLTSLSSAGPLLFWTHRMCGNQGCTSYVSLKVTVSFCKLAPFIFQIRYIIFPDYNTYSCRQLGNFGKICMTKLKWLITLTIISIFYISVCFSWSSTVYTP